MLFSQSIIRRYTPPTCTLEIAAKASPLSRWTKNPIVKELRFELHFDDPRLPAEKKVTIRGDRDRLELLCNVVNNYVRDFLQKPSINLPLKVGVGATSNLSNGHRHAERNYLPEIIELKSLKKELVFPVTPYLQPLGLLYHELFFGSLANETSGKAIQLSAVQLCDLAAALDEYSSDLTVLPNLDRSDKEHYFEGWANTAAIILAVGLTGGIAFFYQNQRPNDAVVSEKKVVPIPAPTQLQPIAVLPPLPPTTKNSPVPQANLPKSFADRQKLLPPAPVTLPQAPTPIASKAKTDRSETAKSNAPANKEVTISIEESKTQVQKAPSNLQPSSSARNDRQPNNAPTKTTNIPTTTIPKLPSLPPLTERNTEGAVNDRGISASVPTIAGASRLATRSIPTDAGDFPDADNTTAAAGNTLSNEPDRLTEVKQYFDRQWQPQQGLNKALEYRLLVDNNGLLKRVVPLGEISTLYLDRTNMPPVDRPFVSPSQDRDNTLIRLVLDPDGKVKAFLENVGVNDKR